MVFSMRRTSVSLSRVGTDSWKQPCAAISWPASTMVRKARGKVSIECTGVHQVPWTPYLSKSASRRGTPTSAPNSPRER